MLVVVDTFIACSIFWLVNFKDFPSFDWLVVNLRRSTRIFNAFSRIFEGAQNSWIARDARYPDPGCF